jgi:hypothetical protein
MRIVCLFGFLALIQSQLFSSVSAAPVPVPSKHLNNINELKGLWFSLAEQIPQSGYRTAQTTPFVNCDYNRTFSFFDNGNGNSDHSLKLVSSCMTEKPLVHQVSGTISLSNPGEKLIYKVNGNAPFELDVVEYYDNYGKYVILASPDHSLLFLLSGIEGFGDNVAFYEFAGWNSDLTAKGFDTSKIIVKNDGDQLWNGKPLSHFTCPPEGCS